MYSIYRTRKHKVSDLKGVAGHNFRTRSTPNADPSRLSENITRGATDIEAAVRARCKSLNLNITPSKIAAIEHLFTASPEFFENKNKDKVREWAQHCVDYLDEKYGLENIVSVSLHLDEKTPHLHAIHVPITTFKRVNVVGESGKPAQQLVDTGKPRLNAAAFLAGSKQKMRDLQTEVAEHIQKKYPQLMRGEDARQTRATHQSISEWFSGLNKKAQKSIKDIVTSFRKINNSKKMMKGKAYEDLYNEKVLPQLVSINEQLIALREENERLKKNAKAQEKNTAQLSSSNLNQEKEKAEKKALELRQRMAELEKTNRDLVHQMTQQQSEFEHRLDEKAQEQAQEQVRFERDYGTLFNRLVTIEKRRPGEVNHGSRTIDLRAYARSEEQQRYANSIPHSMSNKQSGPTFG